MRGAFFCDGGGEKESLPEALASATKPREAAGRRIENHSLSVCLGGWVSTVPASIM